MSEAEIDNGKDKKNLRCRVAGYLRFVLEIFAFMGNKSLITSFML